jgi:hypothetical protein
MVPDLKVQCKCSVQEHHTFFALGRIPWERYLLRTRELQCNNEFFTYEGVFKHSSVYGDITI